MATLSDGFGIRQIFIALAFIGVYFAFLACRRIQLTIRNRYKYSDIVGLPRHRFFGNLINMGEKLNPALNRHPDYVFEEVWEALGQPPAYLMDLNPVDDNFLIITDPSLAELVVQPSPQFKYSALKSDTLQSMYRLIGVESLIMVEGEEWKHLRKRFNKGFAPSHLHSLAPLIISKTRIFIDRLKTAAEAKEIFMLKEYTQDLTTDIITQLTIEKDFHAQTTPEGQGHKGPLGLLTASRVLSALVFKVGQGFNPLMYFDVVRPVKSWFYEQIFNRELAKVIRQQIEAEAASEREESKNSEEPTSAQAKSITRLALSGLKPDSALIRNTVSQIKSFLFAGQDTTATLIQWMCFELSKATWIESHAKILETLKDEHDAVFGATDDPFNALDVLGKEDEEGRREAEAILGSKLPYTTAFIKETLRLHPPAGTARRIPDISAEYPQSFTLPLPVSPRSSETKQVEVNGLRMYICHYIVQRNKSVWGDDADEFRPDRWLDEETLSKLPTGSWRAFERGPRNCIGQELAMVEAKVVLCAVARGFKFHKEGFSGKKKVDGVVKGDGTDDPDREIWSINNVTSIPMDGMRMRVELAK